MLNGNPIDLSKFVIGKILFLEGTDKKEHSVNSSLILYLKVRNDIISYTVQCDKVTKIYLNRMALNKQLKELPHKLFIRVNREEAINLIFLKDIESKSRSVIMTDGAVFAFSRRDWQLFKADHL